MLLIAGDILEIWVFWDASVIAQVSFEGSKCVPLQAEAVKKKSASKY